MRSVPLGGTALPHFLVLLHLAQEFEGRYTEIKKAHGKYHGLFLVRRKGFEPPTYWFVASYSIQLS